MNEQLQQALAALLNKTVSGIDAGAAFLSAEIPDVIQQLLIWKAAESAISMLFGVMILLACVYATRMCFRGPQIIDSARGVGARGNVKPDFLYDSDGGIHPGIIVVMVVLTIGYIIGIAMASSLDWLQILIAPKVYLLEYAASLAK